MVKINAFILSVLFSVPGFSWGNLGHRTLAEVAAELPTSSQFFTNNNSNVGVLANVPDVNWKKTNYNDEAPTHWFQADYYFKNFKEVIQFPENYAKAVSEYQEKVVVKNGTAIWRIQQFYQLALQALKDRDYKTALEMSGVMAHYIGDLSQPLHVTTNYDGQETNDKGIHAFFETSNIKADAFNFTESNRPRVTEAFEFTVEDLAPNQLHDDVTARAKALLADSKFLSDFNGTLIHVLLEEITRSVTLKDQVIQNDLTLGRKGKGAAAQLDLAKSRLADGAATLSLVFARLWKEAGSPTENSVQKTEVPAFVMPQFN